MSLFNRGINDYTGSAVAELSDGSDLETQLRGNPQAPQFVAPCGDKPQAIVLWMLSLQRKQYGKVYGDSQTTLISNCKGLIKKYDAYTVQRAIKWAVMTSKFPFSFKYVRELIEAMEDNIFVYKERTNDQG